MRKRKISQLKEINDRNLKTITYNKRKRGIIKKAVELSVLCKQEIFMTIFNKENNKLVVYQSSDDFSSQRVNTLLQSNATLNSLYEEHNNFDLNCAGQRKF